MASGVEFQRARRAQAAAAGVRRVTAAVAAAALLATSTASPALAFKLFGRTFFETRDATAAAVPDAQPYKLTVTVAGEKQGGDDKRVRDAVRNASALVRDEKRPPAGAAGLVARARGDYARVVAALYARGHYGGSVRITVAGQPVETIRPDAVLPKPADVAIEVDPGPPFRFGAVKVEGVPDAPLTREDRRALDLKDWELVSGEPAVSGAVLDAEGRLVDYWRNRGHPKAATTRDLVADHRSRTVDVRVTVDPGPAARFGDVTVTGTERMDPEFVRAMSGIRPGIDYDPDTVKRSRDRLQRLGVFASTAIDESARVGPDGLLPITYNVSERKRRLIGGGGSFSTLDGAALEAYWMHRNLFGRAESLRFDASVSRIGAEDLEGLNYAAAATFRRPGTFTPDTDLTLQVTGKREYVDAYESRSVTAKAGLEHSFSAELTGTAGLSVERSYVEDAFGSNDYLIVSLPTTLDYDGRDNKLDPTEGLRGTAAVEPFVDLDGGTAALSAQGSAATYRAVGQRDRLVFAGRVAAGTILGSDDLEDIPATRRFFLGGGGSIRGYEYRSVGPRQDGEVVGGLSFWEASAEMRFKLTDTIGLVPFIDVGAAYRDPFPDFSEDLKVGAGLGLRYYTGLGPLRFDVAVPLNGDGDDDDPSIAFYVGLGQSF